jgi:hypothetical protein
MDNALDTTSKSFSKNTFFNHVFSTSEEGKAEILNIVQYSLLGVIPIVLLNKLIQRFIPDADDDKSSIELLAEVLIQIIVMFVGIILIHRIVTYVPTYSEFKYDSLSLTNVILAFLILVLSIQTKLGLKVNILFDRVTDLWNGTSSERPQANGKRDKRGGSRHTPSRGDQHMESPSIVPHMISAPAATQQTQSYDIRNSFGQSSYVEPAAPEPMPANTLGIGSIF